MGCGLLFDEWSTLVGVNACVVCVLMDCLLVSGELFWFVSLYVVCV